MPLAARVQAKSKNLTVWLIAVIVALAWAGFTQHVWEDYYITYRASKNLATGHGLVFTEGQRVHTFTSPIGVLLPAVASLLTGNSSDMAALWIFRVMAAAALGGAVVLFVGLFNQAGGRGTWWALLFPVALVLTDAKTVDFTINGMETPFLLLFLAWAMRVLFASGELDWRRLGLAGAGMMWTRPDAFVYLGAISVGAWLFRPVDSGWRDRFRQFGGLVSAAGVTVAAYLPWLLWAWWYYGSPVPHTIKAKGLFLPDASLGTLGTWIVEFPGRVWESPLLAAGVFMPTYTQWSEWPSQVMNTAAGLAVVAGLLWVVPWLWWQTRAASLAVLGGLFYLYSCVRFPIPWYMPVVTFLALTVLGLTVVQMAGKEGGRRWMALVAGFPVAAAAILAAFMAIQMRWQQRLIETGNRQVIGAWLRANAVSPQDTVFLEPLGYIGFFSRLKMLDYPGLCSPEVVAARLRAESHSYPFCWSELIMDLQPDWLVLRPYEREYIHNRDPEVLNYYYVKSRDFDVRSSVKAVKFLPGRGYLENDAMFEVYHRRAGLPTKVRIKRIHEKDLLKRDAWGQPAYESDMNLLSHAPSLVEFATAADAGWVAGRFGFMEGAYANPQDATDGADFTITHIAENGTRTELLRRELRPVTVATDRGLQTFRLKLPDNAAGRIELKIEAGPHGSNAYDWTYWSELTIQTPQDWR